MGYIRGFLSLSVVTTSIFHFHLYRSRVCSLFLCCILASLICSRDLQSLLV
ncbi:hypothetical protein Hanom_Chr04g00353351 [Helianthus anomalus]